MRDRERAVWEERERVRLKFRVLFENPLNNRSRGQFYLLLLTLSLPCLTQRFVTLLNIERCVCNTCVLSLWTLFSNDFRIVFRTARYWFLHNSHSFTTCPGKFCRILPEEIFKIFACVGFCPGKLDKNFPLPVPARYPTQLCTTLWTYLGTGYYVYRAIVAVFLWIKLFSFI